MDMNGQLHSAFRANLRRALDETETSQAELARQLGVARSYISNLLAGRYSPGLDVIERIAHALGMEPHEIFEPEKIAH